MANDERRIIFQEEISSSSLSSTMGDISSYNNSVLKDVVLPQLTAAIYDAFGKLGSKPSNEQELAKNIKDYIKINASTEQYIDRILNAMSKQEKTSATKAVVSSGPIVSSSSVSLEKLNAKLLEGLDTLIKEVRKAGVASAKEVLDPVAIKERYTSGVVPIDNAGKETVAVLTKLHGEVAATKDIFNSTKSDIAKLIKITSDGVDSTAEVMDIIPTIGRILSNFTKLKSKSTDVVSSAKSLPGAAKSDITDASTQLRAVKDQVQKQLSADLQQFSKVPQEITQRLVTELSSKVSKNAPSYQNTELLKALEVFESKGFAALGDVINAAKKDVARTLKVEGASRVPEKETKEYLKALNEISNTFATIAKQLPTGPRGNTNWNKLSKASSAIAEVTDTIKVKLEVDAKEAYKELDKLSSKETVVPVVPRVSSDAKKIEKQIKDSVGTPTINVKTRASAPDVPMGKQPEAAAKFKDSVDTFRHDILFTIKALQAAITATDPSDVQYKDSLINKFETLANSGANTPALLKAVTKELDQREQTQRNFYSNPSFGKEAQAALADLRDRIIAAPAKQVVETVIKQPKSMPSTGKNFIKLPPVPPDRPRKQEVKVHKLDTKDNVIEPGIPDPNVPKKSTLQRQAVDDVVKDLGKSLLEVQKSIVASLEKSLPKSGGWEIVRTSKDQNISDYFKRDSGYNQKTAGKQYVLTIADIGKLRKETGLRDASYNADTIVKAYKESVKSDLIARNETNPGRLFKY